MAHGLRGFSLLLAVGTVGCTAPEKIAPQRISMPPLPPPNLAASPTAVSKPSNPPIDNRGQPKPAAAMPTVPDAPMSGQGPAILPPAATMPPNPATMSPIPADSKVPGRGTPTIPTPTPPVGSTIYTPPGLTTPTPPDLGALPAPPPLGGKPIEVPTLPPAK